MTKKTVSCRFVLASLFLMFILIFSLSCGSGSSSGGGSSSGVPQFSFNMEPKSVRTGQPVTLYYSWNDSDGDIRTFYMQVRAGSATATESSSAASIGITGISGSQQRAGIWSGGTVPGTYQISCWVVDAKGQTSNIVVMNLTVLGKEKEGFTDSYSPNISIIIKDLIGIN